MKTTFVGFGKNGRSLFELEKTGAQKIVMDSLQFQIDGIFNDSSSSEIKSQSALILLKTCFSTENIENFRISGVADVLIRSLSMLCDSSYDVKVSLLTLIFVFITGIEGSILHECIVPDNVYCTIIHTFLHSSHKSDFQLAHGKKQESKRKRKLFLNKDGDIIQNILDLNNCLMKFYFTLL
jgi:hypothetical protein